MGKTKVKTRQKIVNMKKILVKKEKEKIQKDRKFSKLMTEKTKLAADTRDNQGQLVRQEQANSAMYLRWNRALGPPYRVLMDTNFINFSMQAKLDIVSSMMDCLLAKCFPIVCSCVIAELERLGSKFRVALRIAKDPRFQRLLCDRTYADDCIVERVTQQRIYIVGTNDRNLKRRLRKVPGVPIMFLKQNKYLIERLPESFLHDQ
eukprot:EG_transcript_26827